MLTKSELKELRDELLSSKKPLIFFDDDTDGTSSYILFYRFLKQYTDEIKGVIVKSSPELKDVVFLRKTEEYNPDKVFVLDKPLMSQDFIDSIKKPVVWLDHHPLQDCKGVRYFNPLKHNSKTCVPDTRPTSYWAFKTVERDISDCLWIAMVGCIGDYFIPEFHKEFTNKYPDLLPKDLKINDAGTVLFETRLGLLCKIINFNLKYPTKDAMTAVKILTRIENPYEILDQTTSAGKYIYKKYLFFNDIFERAKSSVKITDDSLILFEYEDNYSLTSDLANELMYHNPDKIVLIARLKGGEYKCSFRSTNLAIRPILEKALVGIEGYGGGHERACGGAIKMHDWDRFLENLRREIAVHVTK
ncbi:MAG: DHHA1 domain-containing protein [Candidatus Woesearchaeota archaeon]